MVQETTFFIKFGLMKYVLIFFLKVTFSFDLCFFREPRLGSPFPGTGPFHPSFYRRKYEQWLGQLTSLSKALSNMPLSRHWSRSGSVAGGGWSPAHGTGRSPLVAPVSFQLPEELAPVAKARGPPSLLLLWRGGAFLGWVVVPSQEIALKP